MRITVELDEDLVLEAKQSGAESGQSFDAFIAHQLREWLADSWCPELSSKKRRKTRAFRTAPASIHRLHRFAHEGSRRLNRIGPPVRCRRRWRHPLRS